MALVGGQVLAAKYANSHGTSSWRAANSRVKLNPRRAKRLVDYLATRHRAPYRHEKLLNLARNHPPFLYGMNLMKKLPVHDGCVNTICWNKTGEYILSGSDDDNLCITKPTYMFDTSKDYTVLHKVRTQHHGNIFRAQFIPNTNDYLIVSCSSEGPVIVHDINSNNPSIGLFNFNCHSSTIFEVATLQDDESVFLSCGEDKTVRLFDMRCHRSCARASTCPHPALIRNSYAMTTLSIHPTNSNLLLVGRADGLGLVYDRRKLPNPSEFSREKAHLDYKANSDAGKAQPSTFKCLHPLEGVVSQFTVPDMNEKCRFTSLSYSIDGSQVLASYSQDYIYLFDHDRSSNFNLIQTLPKKSASTNEENNNPEYTNQSGGNKSGARQPARRPPRIRVRGDWSDTGINSVPNSLRSDTSSGRNASSILQRMTEVAFYARSGGPRPMSMTELIAGPLNFSNIRNDRSDRAGNNRDNGRGEHDLEGDDNDETETDGEDDDNNDDEDEDEESNSDGEVITATFELSVRSDSNDEEDEEDSNDKRTNRDQKSNNGETGKPKISSKTKNKFRETFASLKDRFNNIPTHHPRVRYQGHRNSKTSIKKAIFWGDDYIMSGSDCGRIMIWEKQTAKLVMGFPADERVVNCLAPNPHQYVLASSGIDYDIKLWSTQNIVDCPLKITQDEMNSIVKNNELMLEEAKQTVTVPPHLFFRVLASFAQNNHLAREN